MPESKNRFLKISIDRCKKTLKLPKYKPGKYAIHCRKLQVQFLPFLP